MLRGHATEPFETIATSTCKSTEIKTTADLRKPGWDYPIIVIDFYGDNQFFFRMSSTIIAVIEDVDFEDTRNGTWSARQGPK